MPEPIAQLNTALEGRYIVEKELGRGGMATVFLAEDVKHRRKVAVKVLKPELAAVLGAERFVHEITTTASLQHPHILPLFDSGTAGGFLYYVMPFIEGETLRAKLDREKQLGIEEAVRITREVADALDYAHRHGVIHRDIKPENILLHDGRPMVADFGIALAVSAAAGGRMTETGLSLGTPHYMSPEQATAEKEITARSDVYSLGSVLYEMLAGEPPHLGGSAQQIIMKIIAESVQPVSALRKSVPGNVAAAVEKALEKLPADRFETAAQFSHALADPSYTSVTGSGARAGGAGVVRGWRGVRTIAAVSVAAFVLGIAGARFFWPRRAESRPATRLMLQFPADQQPRYSTQGAGSMLGLAPDGGGLLYSGPGVTTRTQFWMRAWDRLRATRLAQTLDDACCAVFSPHGDSLAYLTAPHNLAMLPLSGGVSVTLMDSGLTAVTDVGGGLDWGPDGNLYASGLGGILRIAPRGGKVEQVTRLDVPRGDLRHTWPAVLPGAQAALVTVVPTRESGNPERSSIGVADFRTGKVEIILQGLRAMYSPSGYIIFAKANGVLWAVPFDARRLRLAGRERELTDTAAVGSASLRIDMVVGVDGTLAYSKGVVESLQPVWVDRDGSWRPVAKGLSEFSMQDPRLSPDGKQFAVTIGGLDGKTDVWAMPVNGGPKTRLTFEGSATGREVWRPGTRALTFTSDQGTAVRSFIFEVAADGSGRTTKPDLHDARSIGGHSWSPDGKWLLFRTDDQEAGSGDIMAIRPGVDSAARPIVATAAEELSPAVSYDGRWLAYSSNESGRREIYVRPFPEPGTARYQVSTGGGISPAWNRNGRELFYVDATGNMVAVPVSTASTFQAGAPRVLFPASYYFANAFFPQYDVSADGQHFLMIRGESDGMVHVVVVFDFLKELEQRMTAR